MLMRKNSTGPRTKRTRRKRSKFLTPDLVLVAGQKIRHVASRDNPLSKAERLREEYSEMEDGDDAELRQFLQRTYEVAAQFRRHRGEFERLQAHPFWERWRPKPRDPATSKWLLFFIMQATTTSVRKLASKYAAILDGLRRDEVEISAVASRIKELGGAYEASASKPSPTCGQQVQGGSLRKSASSRPASMSGQRSLVSVTKTSSTVSSAVDLASGGNPKGGRLIKGGIGLKLVARRSPPKRPPLNQRALNSRAKLHNALAQTRAELRSAPTDEVRLQLEQEEDFLIEWREQYEKKILERKRALREKKKAARLQRMGGPLRR